MSAGASEDTVRGYLAARVSEGWMPGACWWVEGRRGLLDRGAVGDAALVPEREPATETTLYDLGSLTKPLATALLALVLDDERALDVTGTVGEHLEEFRGSPYETATLTDLAIHRAGLPAWRPLYLEGSDLDGYLAQIARIPRSIPEGKTVYSDLGYIALGAAVQRRGGDALDRLFERRIAGLLGIGDVGFAGLDRKFARAAPTERGNLYERLMAGNAGEDHLWRSRVLRGEVHDGNAYGLGGTAGHAGLFGAVEGVAAIVRAMVHPGRLPMTPPNRHRILNRVPGSESRTFGLVTAHHSSAARGALSPDAPGHCGFTGTSLWIEPEREAFMILLTNRVHPTVQLRGLDPVRNGFHRVALRLT